MSEPMRVQKFLSRAGITSRRKGEKAMKAGRVRVNGQVCRELGTKVVPGRDRVEFDGNPVALPDTFTYILLHKPPNYITTLDDPKGRPTVVDLLPEDLPRIWPVGRLDFDSEGLLVMTNDGKLTNLVTHPSHQISKRYDVRVRGRIQKGSDALRRLRNGVKLDDGYVTHSAGVRITGHDGESTWLQIKLHEGKNRQIRRMGDAVGHPVITLRRIAVGTVHIEGLARGQHRPMTHDEVADLYQIAGVEMPDRAIPDDQQLRREREAIERGELPDHHRRKRRLFDG